MASCSSSVNSESSEPLSGERACCLEWEAAEGAFFGDESGCGGGEGAGEEGGVRESEECL